MTGADDEALADRVEAAISARPIGIAPLQGGSTVAVFKLDFADRPALVAKARQQGESRQLAIERAMLDDLAADGSLPVPGVVHGDDDLLLMAHVTHDAGAAPEDAQRHLGRLVGALHGTPAPAFGYGYDTVIGQLHQPNPRGQDWIGFFADQRLRHMAEAGAREGTVPTRLASRIEALAGRIGRYIDPPAHPALLHGDLWGGNVLHRDGRIVGLIDPALYWGHPEIELAFMTLFGTVTAGFFQAYGEVAPLADGFFDLRRDIYNLYPLLVHVRYWDISYARPIEALLARLGV